MEWSQVAAAGGLACVEVEGSALFVVNLANGVWKQVPDRPPKSGDDVGMVVDEGGGAYYLACKSLDSDPLMLRLHVFDSSRHLWKEVVYDWDDPMNEIWEQLTDNLELDLRGCFIWPHTHNSTAAVYNPQLDSWCQITLPTAVSTCFLYEENRVVCAEVVKVDGEQEVLVWNLDLEGGLDATLDEWRVISRKRLSGEGAVRVRGSGDGHIIVVQQGETSLALVFDLQKKSWQTWSHSHSIYAGKGSNRASRRTRRPVPTSPLKTAKRKKTLESMECVDDNFSMF